ncbi:MAG: alpha/beta fold hydrolase [Halieaceae bacterium]|nr:alpha/beta fold hydrolase [Halieaceae bacterium]
MKKILPLGLLVLIVAFALFAVALTRDGELVTPTGQGTVNVEGSVFEALPLPDYAAKHITADYKSYLIEVEPGIKVHVLDVGEGFPLYVQHGNPTSGFLYRRVVEQLPLDRVRVIMPTLVGLGFSSKIPSSHHTLDNHVRWINAALNQLALPELVYVGQDWGGPVGMGALARSPGLLKGVVALNTSFNAPTEARDLSRAHAVVKTPVVGELVTGVFGSIFDTLPSVQGDPASLPDDVLTLYRKPLKDSGNMKAPLALMRMVPDGPDHPSTPAMRAVEEYANSLDVPAEIIWGMQDPILAQGLPLMEEKFPQAPVTKTQAGHFLQEEVPAEIAGALLRIVAQLQSIQTVTPQVKPALTSGLEAAETQVDEVTE